MSHAKTDPFSRSGMIDRIIGWIREAGQVALQFFDDAGPTYKPDRSLLTAADLAVEHLLAERIGTAFPSYRFIGEEGTRTGPDTELVWLVDPIDGTTAFTQGLPGWGITIGLLQEGKPRLGFYYMPLLDDLTYTAGQGVFCNNRRLKQSLCTRWDQKGFLAINASTHDEFRINIRHSRALGSNSANLVYTARGSATAAFLPKAYLWDLVAGAAMIERLGGECRYLDNSPVKYESLLDGRLAPQPVLAGHTQVLTPLFQAITLR